MFKSKTLFILGAGASAEVNLPIGRKLTELISQKLNIHVDLGSTVQSGDYQIYNTIRRAVNEEPEKWQGNQFLASARHISEAMNMALSIDTFIDSFAADPERVLLSKLGIAKSIYDEERDSKLATEKTHYSPTFNIRDICDTWFVSLAQLLFSGVPIQHIDDIFNDVAFVVFNYDRCLQVFLVKALETYFAVPSARATAIVRGATILHPYGSLGSVFDGTPDYLPFGGESCPLREVAERINTFTESIQDGETLARVRREVQIAETIVFLGFGFHQQNMDVLSEPAPKDAKISQAKKVLATVCGLSKSDTEVVRDLIARTLIGRPLPTRGKFTLDTFNGRCSEFFGEYWRTLTS